MNRFTVGKDLDFDDRLAKYDVFGSMAHCKMLAEVGLISQKESVHLLLVLNEILEEIQNNTFEIDPEAEDIHSQIEAILIKKLGLAGKKYTLLVPETIRFCWILNCICWMKSGKLAA